MIQYLLIALFTLLFFGYVLRNNTEVRPYTIFLCGLCWPMSWLIFVFLFFKRVLESDDDF